MGWKWESMAKDKQIRVFTTLDELYRAAADHFAGVVKQAVRSRGVASVALSGGGTPQRLFQLLAQLPFKASIPWETVHFYWGDERCVPPDDQESNYGQAHELLLRHVDIPDGNIHRIKGEINPVEASKDYDRVLKQYAPPHSEWPRFDLVLLGMGEDGHTASLFPGSPVEVLTPTLAVTAHYEDRPAERVTLTPPVINSARLIVFMVVGANKALTLGKVLNGPYQPELIPAQRIAPEDGKLIWLVDEAAASQLSGKK